MSSVKIIKTYRKRVEYELTNICSDILSVIDEHLILCSTTGESTVFFCSIPSVLAQMFFDIYMKDRQHLFPIFVAATAIASSDLAPAHPIRHGLALNFLIFYYEILNSPERLEINLMDNRYKSFDKAIAKLDSLSEESYKGSTLIMQFLRDTHFVDIRSIRGKYALWDALIFSMLIRFLMIADNYELGVNGYFIW
ncbi:14-3-3-like protein GF14 iota [Capsicum annuum]|uniref:14-3-3-like protein GF14 iota n=1 Tax=Capsicum annuum TaxID=4072 RepID=A0A2G2YWB0_CAPAN|nr:14-3-3-like protein GF14 iota [Capsicum annuum]KAF3642930.1 14-3-3-like protein GF14 iota [Capsicum annuum]PHT74057.1 14-3-3-like protein GF14 iota [Capsicum annuum]